VRGVNPDLKKSGERGERGPRDGFTGSVRLTTTVGEAQNHPYTEKGLVKKGGREARRRNE